MSVETTKHKCGNCESIVIVNDICYPLEASHVPANPPKGLESLADARQAAKFLIEDFETAGGHIRNQHKVVPVLRALLEPGGEKHRVVVSVHGGLVSAIYGDETAVQVLVVDHDNIEVGRGEGGDAEDHSADDWPLVPLAEMSKETKAEVEFFEKVCSDGVFVCSNCTLSDSIPGEIHVESAECDKCELCVNCCPHGGQE